MTFAWFGISPKFPWQLETMNCVIIGSDKLFSVTISVLTIQTKLGSNTKKRFLVHFFLDNICWCCINKRTSKTLTNYCLSYYSPTNSEDVPYCYFIWLQRRKNSCLTRINFLSWLNRTYMYLLFLEYIHRASFLAIPRYGISIIKIRRSWDRPILIMGIPLVVRRHPYIETGLNLYHMDIQLWKFSRQAILWDF